MTVVSRVMRPQDFSIARNSPPEIHLLPTFSPFASSHPLIYPNTFVEMPTLSLSIRISTVPSVSYYEWSKLKYSKTKSRHFLNIPITQVWARVTEGSPLQSQDHSMDLVREIFSFAWVEIPRQLIVMDQCRGDWDSEAKIEIDFRRTWKRNEMRWDSGGRGEEGEILLSKRARASWR